MSNKSGERQVAYYRSKDPISNLRIRVTLKKLTASTMFPVDDDKPNVTAKNKVSAKEKLDQFKKGKTAESETTVVSFGEKRFSHREVLKYSSDIAINAGESGGATTDKTLQNDSYRSTCRTDFGGDPQKRPNNRIFTYVQGDGFVEDYETRAMTDDPNESQSYLSRQMANLRRRPNATSDKTSHFGKSKALVVETPTEEAKKASHYLQKTGVTFHVMADLTPAAAAGGTEEHTEQDEHLLCTINVSSSGVITLLPDFNRHRPPYTVVSDRERREVYEYTIEHVSSEMTGRDRLRERKVMHEIYARHHEYLLKSVGQEFELPQPGMLRLNTFGQLVSASNFEYDSGLYVQYYLDVPPMWWADPNCQITGVTQRCTSSVAQNGKDETCNFCFPFEFELFYRNDGLENDAAAAVSTWPVMFVEVLSLDSWLRFRTEGYGWVRLPMTPGCHTLEVHCWRPTGDNSVGSELRRFFVGGSPELEDITYSALPTTHQGVILSKYGLKTESTGTVTVSFNTVMQSQLFMGQALKGGGGGGRRKQVAMIDRLGGHSMQATVASVLDTFMKTRSRMRSAREGLIRA